METLDLAQVHGRALITLAVGAPSAIRRAERFFMAVLVPIVDTHRSSRESRLALSRTLEQLRRRTAELDGVNRLRQRVVRGSARVDAALVASTERNAGLLEASLQVQAKLRTLLHDLLGSHEDDRRNTSRNLQDEIAQALLGISVRLQALRQGVQSTANRLATDIEQSRQLAAPIRRHAHRLLWPSSQR